MVLGRNGQQLGTDVRGGFAGLDGGVLKTALHALVDRVGLVAGGLQAGVGAQTFGQAIPVSASKRKRSAMVLGESCRACRGISAN